MPQAGAEALGQYAPAQRKVGGSGPFKDSSWFVWNMLYPGGKPLRVQVSYQQQLLSLAMYSVEYPFPAAILVSYVLRTGALWDGPIGSVVVTMTASDAGGLIPILPATHSADGQLTWSMSNFKPTGRYRGGVRARCQLAGAEGRVRGQPDDRVRE